MEILNQCLLSANPTQSSYAREASQLFVHLIASQTNTREIILSLGNQCGGHVRVELVDNGSCQSVVEENRGAAGSESTPIPIASYTARLDIGDNRAVLITLAKTGAAICNQDIIRMMTLLPLFAITMQKQLELDGVVQNYRYTFLNDLVDSHIRSEDEALERGRFYHVEFHIPLIMVVVSVTSAASDARDSGSVIEFSALEDMSMKHIQKEIGLKLEDVIIWQRGQRFILAVPVSRKARRNRVSAE